MTRGFLQFIRELEILKITRRTGWQWRGIRDCESIADHCFRVVVLAMAAADSVNAGTDDSNQKVNSLKVIKMATIHELAEARVGDIPYPALRYIWKTTKGEAELEAFSDIVAPLPPAVAEEYRELFIEFENSESVEARLVKAADKLEMMIQCLEYERVGYRGLDDFWNNSDTDRQIAEFGHLNQMYQEVRAEHQQIAGKDKG